MLPSTAEGSLPDGFCDLIDVFHGEMTCCSLGHRKGTVTCDREKLVKPMYDQDEFRGLTRFEPRRFSGVDRWVVREGLF